MTEFKVFIFYFLCFFTTISFAQETDNKTETIQVVNKPTLSTETAPDPKVGKHVMANMNASNMILSLLMVLGLIVICAIVLKRFNLTQQNSNQLKVIANLSLGAKERVLVVQIGEQQLVLGVCPQQISLLKTLDKPLDIESGKPLALSGNVLSFLQKNTFDQRNENNKTSNETTNK